MRAQNRTGLIVLLTTVSLIGACAIPSCFANTNICTTDCDKPRPTPEPKTVEPIRVSTDLKNPWLKCPDIVDGHDVHAEWMVGTGGTLFNLRCVVGW